VSFTGVPVRDALDSASIALSAAGVESPRLDAELLLADALGVDRATLAREPELPLEGPAVRAFQSAVRRRAVEREPVAYITGRRAFRALELAVDRRVLIPRPETELLVEAALTLDPATSVLDVGTGCGAVALALKHERPDLRVGASDLSIDALAVARSNASRLGLEVRFLHADLLEGVSGYEAIVSNPPYVEDRARLAPEIGRHEPPSALYGGADGTVVARRLIEQAAAAGQVRWLAVELGQGQVSALVDLAGIERVLVARR
jgi:release factor glutamine methyltransferase